MEKLWWEKKRQLNWLVPPKAGCVSV